MRIKDLSFRYKDRRLILDNVSFSANGGEITSIIGPNGAGKSTVLKCIARVIKPSSGRILLDSKDIANLNGDEFAKTIGYTPQNLVRSSISVFDAVLIGRKPYMGWSISDEDVKVAEKIIKLFKLEPLAFKSLKSISGGELQKVWIARAVVQRPRALLLDEPMNNLDISNQIGIMKLIRDLTRNMQIITVIVFHDINMALRFSDKLLAIKNGKVIAYGERDIVNPSLIENLYGIKSKLLRVDDIPLIVPEV